MANLTREQILARKIGRGTVTLPDGSTVAIRALTREEVVKGQDMPAHEREFYYIATGMTDPKLSLDDVKAWADQAPAGDLVAVSEGIARLSGLLEDSGKGAYKSTRK